MDSKEKFIVFSIEDQCFALPVLAVQIVIHAVELTIIPDSPYILAGIINMEGEIISVINLRRCFNIPDREIKLSDRFIIVRSDNRKMALIVDSVCDMLNTSPDDITGSEKIFSGLSQTGGAIRGNDSVIPVINIAWFFNYYNEKPADDNIQHGEGVVCTQDT